MMAPDWLIGDVSVKWFEAGEWRDCTPDADGVFIGGDGAIVRIRWQSLIGETGGADALAVCEAEAVPGASGQASGWLLRLPLRPELACVWKPHLSPSAGMIIGDKAFRSPAIIFEDAERMYALIPDLQRMRAEEEWPHVMDYTLEGHELIYGRCRYRETGHVYYELDPQPERVEKASFRFYLASWNKEATASPRDFRPVERWLWQRFAGPEMSAKRAVPKIADLEVYVKHTYAWAFDRWKDVCWQSFELDGARVGGVVFIVTARQKPGGGEEECWREPKSLWNQAWFSGLRSAYGYRLWGEAWCRDDLTAYSREALSFALSAPQTNGLFPGYYVAGEHGWGDGRWVSSPPRRPAGLEGYVHLLDSSWTCYWLLKWRRDLEADERILPYVRRYAETLLKLQQPDGSFPAWVDPVTLACSPHLEVSSETAAHIQMLCLLYMFEPDERYLAASVSAARFLLDRIVATGRWEDFETYWSCAKTWSGKQPGVHDARSGLYNQNTLGMYWCAEAFLSLHTTTGEAAYLDAGERVLAEISLYQQIWEPGYIAVPVLGGFGVMNCDNEWNDARQSLFALTYDRYYRATGNETYRLRGLWAMKASFYMMYCPENPTVKQLYERVHPHFDERDFGFHMENFNHHDGTARDGLGEFTIFDWGNGAAGATLGELLWLV